MHVASPLDAVAARGFAPATVAMDMGYDHNRIYAECADRDCAVIPLRKGQKERDVRIPRGIDEWRTLYRRRARIRTAEAQLRPRVPAGAGLGARPVAR